MAEQQVTIGETSYKLPNPFFVLATQNPIEQEGTYSLPEAELDRFLMKLEVPYPQPEDEMQIVRTMGKANEVPVKKILSAQVLQKCRAAVDAITADDKILQYIVSLITVTRPTQHQSSAQHRNDILRYISFGASPRAGIALLKCAKVNALFENRSFVLPEDVQAVHKFLVQRFAKRIVFIKEQRIGIRVEELPKLIFRLSSQDILLTSQNKVYQRILKLYETLTTDGRIGNRLVVRNDEVETNPEEVIVEPLGNSRLHVAQLLVCLGSVQSLQQIGLARKPIAYSILVGIICWGQLEAVAYAVECFGKDIFGIEPAEALVQLGIRAKTYSVQLQRCLLAHLFYKGEGASKCCCYRIALANFCMTLAESINIQAIRHGLRPSAEVFAQKGIPLLLRHHITVADLASAILSETAVNGSMHQNLRLIA
jgi:hypothetical protein